MGDKCDDVDLGFLVVCDCAPTAAVVVIRDLSIVGARLGTNFTDYYA